MDTERRYFPSRAMLTEPSSPLGDIKINFEVIANIVKLTAMEVPGVLSVGGGFFRQIAAALGSRKQVLDGVRLEEEGDGYAIKLRVQVAFGVELSRVAYEIQTKVRENLETMANVNATRIDVVVDAIKRVNTVTT